MAITNDPIVIYLERKEQMCAKTKSQVRLEPFRRQVKRRLRRNPDLGPNLEYKLRVRAPKKIEDKGLRTAGAGVSLFVVQRLRHMTEARQVP